MLDLSFEEVEDNFNAMQDTTIQSISACTWYPECAGAKFHANAVADKSFWNEVLHIQAGALQY